MGGLGVFFVIVIVEDNLQKHQLKQFPTRPQSLEAAGNFLQRHISKSKCTRHGNRAV